MSTAPDIEIADGGKQIQIRVAEATDLPAVVKVLAKTVVASDYYAECSNEEAERQHHEPRIVGYFHGSYHPSYALTERSLIVAEEGTQIVGFIAGHRSQRMKCTGELQWMFVLPEWQRQGIGAKLLQPLAQWFIDQKSTRVIIDAPPENPFRAFYLKHGAQALDQYWLYWPDVSKIP